MTQRHLFTLGIFLSLIFLMPSARAEYYLECNEPIPNVVDITCKGHHCRWKVQHYSNYHRDTKHRRDPNIVRYCNQDMATGDDNACRHPDLQIN